MSRRCATCNVSVTKIRSLVCLAGQRRIPWRWTRLDVRIGSFRYSRVGDQRPSVRLFRYMATRHHTGTTIVTFLMVFLIQNSQNRDNAAIQVKLDEIIRASQVRNSFIGIEHLSDEEIEELRRKTERSAAGEVDDGVVEDVGEKARHAADSIGG
jgi:low affinity Fe/Cu permease